jgi:hypothetical protein
MKQVYRSVDFNDERKWKASNLLDDVMQVGIKKSIGYICNQPTEEHRKLKKQFIKEGKLVYLDLTEDFSILWVGDPQMMQTIIDKNKNILLENGWKTDTKLVFKEITKTDIAHNENKKLYHLICKFFNSWCLWCQRPIKAPKNSKYSVLSEHPYDPDNER